MHQHRKTLGDGEAKAAALGVAGGVPPDKAAHQLIGADVEPIPGDVLHRNDRRAVQHAGVDIDPGAGQGILAHIAEQVVDDAPQVAPVAHGDDGLLRGLHHRADPRLPEPILIFAGDLHQQLAQIHGSQLHLQVAGGCLGRLHQILRQLFEPVGLALEHLHIGPGVLAQIQLAQQIDIVHDAGQRSL